MPFTKSLEQDLVREVPGSRALGTCLVGMAHDEFRVHLGMRSRNCTRIRQPKSGIPRGHRWAPAVWPPPRLAPPKHEAPCGQARHSVGIPGMAIEIVCNKATRQGKKVGSQPERDVRREATRQKGSSCSCVSRGEPQRAGALSLSARHLPLAHPVSGRGGPRFGQDGRAPAVDDGLYLFGGEACLAPTVPRFAPMNLPRSARRGRIMGCRSRRQWRLSLVLPRGRLA